LPNEGTGLLADLGPHLIDQALLLFGPPDTIAGDISSQRVGTLVDDYFELTLHYGAKRVILSASTLIRLASGPLVGRLADLSGRLRSVLALCIVIAGAAAATFSWADGFWLFFLIALVQAAALAPTTSIADALTVSAARPVIAGKPFAVEGGAPSFSRACFAPFPPQWPSSR